MKEIKKEDITDFLEKMSNVINKDTIELYKNIAESSKIKKHNDYKEFFHSVIYPFGKFVDGFVRSKIANNNDIVFIYRHSQFVERHFERLISFKEGFPCCADKSRTIMSRLINFFKTGKKIVWDYKQEYHMPTKIFTTHDEIVNFYNALKSLWYGDHRKYIEELAFILESGEDV